MQAITNIETGIFLAVATILIWAAVTDLKYRKISNSSSLAITGLFVVSSVLFLFQGAEWKPILLWPILSAALVFAVGVGLFAVGLMGGGDVKLIAATALFAGPALSLPLVLYVTVAGGFVALLTLLHAKLKSKTNTPPKVPYGVAITVGGLWVCFQRISTL
ncbi:MAG: prepilin peptidase [Kordiimonadaceae bacterium]|nr:prepilin peptidase [Kordiimonadaceae bacterium]